MKITKIVQILKTLINYIKIYVFSERNCKQMFQIYDVFLEQRYNFLIKSESAIYFFVKRLMLVLLKLFSEKPYTGARQ